MYDIHIICWPSIDTNLYYIWIIKFMKHKPIVPFGLPMELGVYIYVSTRPNMDNLGRCHYMLHFSYMYVWRIFYRDIIFFPPNLSYPIVT